MQPQGLPFASVMGTTCRRNGKQLEMLRFKLHITMPDGHRVENATNWQAVADEIAQDWRNMGASVEIHQEWEQV